VAFRYRSSALKGWRHIEPLVAATLVTAAVDLLKSRF
jgi:hypothetical protein